MLRGIHIVCALSALNGSPAVRSPAQAADALDRLLAQHPIRPIVGSPVLGDEDGSPLLFLVGGHLYGNPAHRERVQPAATFTSRVPELSAMKAEFFISLGDVFRNHDEANIEGTLATLRGLEMPVYNAVGNHEVWKKRQEYTERFGPTFGGFRIGTSLFVILDTELDPWRITGEQLDFLRQALAIAPAAGMQRLFLFSHRVLFATGNERYDIVFSHCNSRSEWPGDSNFASEVRPLLAAFRKVGEVTWFSGDVGAPGSYGLFVDTDPEIGVRYVATGLGEVESDSLLTVRVGVDGGVSLERVPLTEVPLTSLDECGVAAWKERFPPKKHRRRGARPPSEPTPAGEDGKGSKDNKGSKDGEGVRDR